MDVYVVARMCYDEILYLKGVFDDKEAADTFAEEMEAAYFHQQDSYRVLPVTKNPVLGPPT